MGDGENCGNVDECSEKAHNCVQPALCMDTIGSFTCLCPEANVPGDGVLCPVMTSTTQPKNGLAGLITPVSGNRDDGGDKSTAAGAIVGGLLAACIIVFVVVLLMRRRQRRNAVVLAWSGEEATMTNNPLYQPNVQAFQAGGVAFSIPFQQALTEENHYAQLALAGSAFSGPSDYNQLSRHENLPPEYGTLDIHNISAANTAWPLVSDVYNRLGIPVSRVSDHSAVNPYSMPTIDMSEEQEYAHLQQSSQVVYAVPLAS